MKFFVCLSLLVLTLTGLTSTLATGAAGATAPKKIWHTYPMPPTIKTTDPIAGLAPGKAIPENPEQYTWKVSAPKNEPKLTIVPVYAGGARERLSKIGNVAVGTALTLDQVRLAGRVHYYGIKFTPEGGKETMAWVSGNYVAPAGPATSPTVQ